MSDMGIHLISVNFQLDSLVNSVPDNKILALSKVAEDKLKVTQNIKFVFNNNK